MAACCLKEQGQQMLHQLTLKISFYGCGFTYENIHDIKQQKFRQLTLTDFILELYTTETRPQYRNCTVQTQISAAL